MKRFVFVLFTLICTTIVYGQTLEQAEDAYRNRNYSAAIDLYESALLGDNISGEIYFNLGNAYFINGQLGQAILNYRLAEQYLPRNEVIVSQLARARSERVDGIIADSDWVVIMSNITSDWLTLTETSVITFIIWVVFFVILAIGIRQRGLLLSISLFGVIMVITVSLLSTRLYAETQRPTGVILAISTGVMSGPGDNYLSLYTLYEGAEIRVLDERDGWVRLVLPDNRQGWIRENTMGFVVQK